MTGPFLVLHKVRGEPEFDIAIPLQIGDEDGWIIPTSGHRCYPAKAWRLSELNIPPFEAYTTGQNWDILPDHYSVNADVTTVDLSTILGIEPPKQITIRRRI